jgi:hypothetical protein
MDLVLCQIAETESFLGSLQQEHEIAQSRLCEADEQIGFMIMFLEETSVSDPHLPQPPSTSPPTTAHESSIAESATTFYGDSSSDNIEIDDEELTPLSSDATVPLTLAALQQLEEVP